MKSIALALGVIGFAAAAQPAAATVHVISLTGTAASATFNSFTVGGNTYHTGTIQFDPFTPFTIVEGDTIEATVTLTGGFTVPASGEQLFGLNFFRTDGADPVITATMFETTVSGSGTFSYSGGPTGLPSDTQGGACSNCLTSIMGQIPGDAFIFDGFTQSLSIDRLGAPYEIDASSFTYQLRDIATAVPEPATWALLILGFGVVGGAMRRRVATRVRFA